MVPPRQALGRRDVTRLRPALIDLAFIVGIGTALFWLGRSGEATRQARGRFKETSETDRKIDDVNTGSGITADDLKSLSERARRKGDLRAHRSADDRARQSLGRRRRPAIRHDRTRADRHSRCGV